MAELAFYPTVLTAERFAKESAALFAKYGRGMIRRTNLALHLDPTLPPQAVEFPPGPLTAAATTFGDGYSYGAGTYVASASSTFVHPTTSTYFPFDKVTNSATGNVWCTLTQSYNATTGAYTAGTYTTAIDGGSGGVVAGEWLQLQLPQPIALASFIMHAMNDTNYFKRAPADITVLGSNNGARWSRVGAAITGLAFMTPGQGQTVAVNCAARYRFYRFVVTAIQAGSANYFCSIGELRLFGDPSPADSAVLVAPVADLSGNGVAVVPVGAARVVAPSGAVASWLFTDYGWLATALKPTIAAATLFSYEAWFYYPKGALTASQDHTALVSNWGSPTLASDAVVSGMHVDSAGFLRAYDGAQSAPKLRCAVPVDQWVHAVLTASATALSLYVDGVLAGSFAGRAANAVSGQGIHVGGGTSARGGAIAMGPVRVYVGTALSAQDVSRHYNAEKARVATARAAIPALVGDALHLDAQHAVSQTDAALPVAKAPKIWLRLEELSALADGASVASWPSAAGTAVAVGLGTMPVLTRPATGQPFVRMGTGFSSSSVTSSGFSLGKQTFNLATSANGAGFTAVCLVRMRASPGAAETVFDFGASASGTNTLALTRSDTGKAGVVVRNGSATQVDVTLGGVDIPSDWAVIAVRVSATATAFWSADGTLTSTAVAATMTDRTLTGCFIGRSWAGTSFASMDVREMLFFEGALSDAEVGLLRGYLAAKFVTLPLAPVTPALAPKIWLRMDELSGLAHGAAVDTWSSAIGTIVATATSVGSGIKPVLNRSEVTPFVRLGTGTSSTANGGYFDCGSVTWDMPATGGFTAVCAVRFRGPVTNFEKIFDFGVANLSVNMWLARDATSDTLKAFAYTTSTTTTSAFSAAGGITAGWQVVAMRLSPNDTTVWTDGTKVTTAGQPNQVRACAVTYFGKSATTATDPYANIDYRELMFFDGALSDSEVGMARAYMNTKFGAPIALTKPVAASPITPPKIWLRMDELSGLAHGALVPSWASAVGTAIATGTAVGTGTVPAVNRTLETYPFVRMGTDTASTANGGYFDCGPQTFNMLAAGGFTAVCAIRMRSASVAERIFEFGNAYLVDSIVVSRAYATGNYSASTYGSTFNAITASLATTTAIVDTPIAWHVIAMRITASDFSFFSPTGVKTTGAGITLSNKTLAKTCIGAMSVSDVTYSNMDVRELMFFDGGLSDFEVATLRARLAAKFATTLPATPTSTTMTAATPKIWLRMDELAGLAHGAEVASWASAAGSAVATGGSVGTGVKPTIMRTLESQPFVRMGTDTNSTANGGFFDMGAQTFNTLTTGGFTAICAVRLRSAGNSERIFEIGAANLTYAYAMYRSISDKYAVGSWDAAAQGLIDGQAIAFNAWVVIAARITASDITMFNHDGTKTARAGVTLTNRTSVTSYIGKSTMSADNYSNLDVREMMFFDGALSDVEVERCRMYMIAKYAPAVSPSSSVRSVRGLPKIWLRMDELSTLAHGASVAAWPSATGSATAQGYKAGTGAGYVPKIDATSEPFPFVRMGTGGNSNADGGYFDIGRQTFNMATNGGFTAVIMVRMYASTSWERVFEFGSGQANDNVCLCRYGEDAYYSTFVYNGNTAVVNNIVFGGAAKTTGGWQVMAVRFTGSEIACFTHDGTKLTATNSTAINNRTVSNTYIGRSAWTSFTNYPNMDVRELMFFDGALTDAEVGQARAYLLAKYPVTALTMVPSLPAARSPKLWLRMEELSSLTADDALVTTWPGALGSPSATGFAVGTGTRPKVKRVLEASYPFVRLGTGTTSLVNGGYLDFGSQTFNTLTNGGFTAVCAFRLPGPASSYERVFDFYASGHIGRYEAGTTLTANYSNADSSGSAGLNIASAITGGWQTVAMRVTASEVAYFATDGTKTTGAGVTIANRTSPNTYIGKVTYTGPGFATSNNYANVDIRELMFFDGALADNEIAMLRASLATKFAAGASPIVSTMWPDRNAALAVPPTLPVARMPKLWLRMDDLAALTHDSSVGSWPSAIGSAVATGYKAGTGAVPAVNRTLEAYPFVRMGTGASTTVNGGYFDFGPQTFNMATNGGFTAVMAVRMPTPLNGARFFEFGSGYPGNNIIAWTDTTYYYYTVANASSWSTASIANATVSTTAWQIVALRCSNTESSFFSDSGAKTTYVTYTLTDRTLSNCYIGKSVSNGEVYATLDIREMMFFDGALSDNEIQLLQYSLGAKFASSSSAPATWQDRSGNGNDLALTSCSMGTGGGVRFDGATSFGYRPALSGFSSKDAYTLVAWVQAADVAGNGSLIGMNRTPSIYTSSYMWNVNSFMDYSTSSLGFGSAADFYSAKPANAAPASASQWCMLAFVKERTTGRFYLDGARSSADLSAAVNVAFSPANLCIGKDFRDGVRFFNGSMGLLAAFNRALTDAEITAMHELYRGRFAPAYKTLAPVLLAASTSALVITSSTNAVVNLPALMMPTTYVTAGRTTWSLVGAPPAGVSLNRATGDIRVTRGTMLANVTLHVTATNAAGTATRTLVLNPAFPPVPLTANSFTVAGAATGNGAYVASASTELASTGLAFNAFSAGTSGSATGWAQLSPTGTYTGTAFAYSGAVTATTAAGVSYVGEWVQLSMPTAIQLTSYTVASKTLARAPQDWVLLGSNDGGTTWALVDTRTAATGYLITTPKSFAVTATTLYSTFRMVVSKSTSALLAVYDLRFYGAPAGTWANDAVRQPTATVSIVENGVSVSPTLISGSTYYYRFTSSGTIQFSRHVTCDLLMVGGGASGGTSIGGGGGAGGVVYMENKVMAGSTNYTVTVGTGGASPGNNSLFTGNNGTDSVIQTGAADVQLDGLVLRGKGGGHGGSYYDNLNNATYNPGRSGGSGGGASDNNGDVSYNGGTSLQGNTYWNGTAYVSGGSAGRANATGQYYGGGGGGMGTNGATYKDGNSGVQNSITGSAVWYAAGGGAGTNLNTGNGVGGNGGGSGGRGNGGSIVVTSGTAGTGSGGGGGGFAYIAGDSYQSGAGGSGAVVVRFTLNEIPQPTVYPNAAAIRTAFSPSTPADGDYWILPPGQTTPLLCYVNFTNAAATKGWVLVQRGRESLDYWAAAGQNTGTGLTLGNIGANTPVANAPSAWVNGLTGSWSGTRLLLNRPATNDSYIYKGTSAAQQFAWSLFGIGSTRISTVNADVARYTSMWASGTAATTGTANNTDRWVDTSLVSPATASDQTRSFCWTWTEYGGYQGWSYGEIGAPADSYKIPAGGYGLTRANVYVEC
jgi:hypothetical protein